jgi:hypothetical protein
MNNMEDKNTNNPLEHTANVKKEFRVLIDHLRKDIERINDAAGKALFEVSAEVLIGLEKAFTDYEEKNEAAWRK